MVETHSETQILILFTPSVTALLTPICTVEAVGQLSFTDFELREQIRPSVFTPVLARFVHTFGLSLFTPFFAPFAKEKQFANFVFLAL